MSLQCAIVVNVSFMDSVWCLENHSYRETQQVVYSLG